MMANAMFLNTASAGSNGPPAGMENFFAKQLSN